VINITRRQQLAAMLCAATEGMLSGTLPASAKDEKKISILTSPTGSGPYQAWAVLQTRARENHPWLRPIAVETPGFNYNVKFFAEKPSLWQNTLIGSGSVLEWAAKTGLKPFYPEPLKAASDFRIIGVMALTGITFVTTEPAVQKIADFEGKRIAIGLLTQNEWGMYPRMLFDGLGLTKKLRALNPLGTDPNVEALLDGRADVATLVAFSNEDLKHTITPSPFKLLEASKRSWHYVNVPKALVEEYNKKTGAPFQARVYGSNLLPNQHGDVATFGDFLLLSGHKTFPDDLAYEFVKLWIKMGPIAAKYNAMGKIWDPHSIAAAARDTPNLIHPGAMRAYRELGLVT
jgi:uncharacterized protein